VRIVFKRAAFILAVALLLAAAAASLSLAQVTVDPIEGVRGFGAIKTSNTNIGQLDINVARTSTGLIGGFRFLEFTPTGARPQNVVISKTIIDLEIRPTNATDPPEPSDLPGMYAKVIADGLWNNMPSDLLVEVRDMGPGVDWIHVVARPRGMLPVIYERAGWLFRGDIVVYRNVPSPDGYTKGEGTIEVPNPAGTVPNIGKFRFAAEKILGAVKGSLYYVEYTPYMTTIPVIRPGVRIYLPQVKTLEIQGNQAIFSGPGTLNGRPAQIDVRVVDNSMLMTPIPVPDEFYIKAVSPVASTIVSGVYEAGGPLKTGDIVVGTIVP